MSESIEIVEGIEGSIDEDVEMEVQEEQKGPTGTLESLSGLLESQPISDAVDSHLKRVQSDRLEAKKEDEEEVD